MKDDRCADDVLGEQVEYYKARASEYDDWFFRRGRHFRGEEPTRVWFEELAEVKSALAEVALDGADVLELAPGTGLWTELVAERASSVTAVDASHEMVELARSRLGNRSSKVSFVEADLFDWDPGHQYDAVVFCFWISHVPVSRLDGFLATVARALRPGGSLFFLDGQRVVDSTAVDHVLPGEDEELMTRRLDDGREYRIVKNFWDGSDLERRLAAVGITAKVTSTRRFFQYGIGLRDEVHHDESVRD